MAGFRQSDRDVAHARFRRDLTTHAY